MAAAVETARYSRQRLMTTLHSGALVVAMALVAWAMVAAAVMVQPPEPVAVVLAAPTPEVAAGVPALGCAAMEVAVARCLRRLSRAQRRRRGPCAVS